MKLINYDKDTREFSLNVKETLTDVELEVLRTIAQREHGQISVADVYGHCGEKTDEEFEKHREFWGNTMNLEDLYLIEQMGIGPLDKETQVFSITHIGKLVLKMADGQLNTEGTTYA